MDCIAKNFETLEPGASFRVLRKFLYKKYGEEAGKRIIATGSKGSSLERICEQHGYTFLEFPENVGGRFSAITSVGLLPMAVAGIDIQKLVKGAADMEKQLLLDESNGNIAWQYACIRNMYYKKGYSLELLTGFEPQFQGISFFVIHIPDARDVYKRQARYRLDAREYSEMTYSREEILVHLPQEDRRQL